MAYDYGAKYTQAEPLLVQSLDVDRRTLGEKHSDTLQMWQRSHGYYYDEGKYSQAEPLYRQALDVRRRLQGEEHSDTLELMSGLAQNYWRQGNYIEELSRSTAGCWKSTSVYSAKTIQLP